MESINKTNQVVGTDVLGIQSRDKTDESIETDQTYVPEFGEEEQKEEEEQNLRRSKRGHIPSWKYLARYEENE